MKYIETLSKEQFKDLRIDTQLALDEVAMVIEDKNLKKKLRREDKVKLIEKFKGNIDDICDYLGEKYGVSFI